MEAVHTPVRQPQRRMKWSEQTRSPQENRGPRPSPNTEQREADRSEFGVNIDQVLDDSFPASDPPSWTGAISRVAAAPERRHPTDEYVARRIRAEFLEMPGLCLTLPQAQRLWSLEPGKCEAILNSLIESRFLRRTDQGLFVLHHQRG